MGPRKSQSAEEVDEIKKSLDFLAGEISAVRLQQKGILDLVEEVKILRIQNAEKDKRLEYLESRVEDLEQYTRIIDVIITGLKVKPRSYARAVGADAGGEPGELDASSTEQQVAAFLHLSGEDSQSVRRGLSVCQERTLSLSGEDSQSERRGLSVCQERTLSLRGEDSQSVGRGLSVCQERTLSLSGEDSQSVRRGLSV
ncbi:hypothetical protein NQZ68_039025 [Dissostichus eleginoides]|nr:hypothetical protein NQZ68_039025 [Dissostichus eleginoides]